MNSCKQQEEKGTEAKQETTTAKPDETSDESLSEEDESEGEGSLNAIRFEGWTEGDYYDNEYVRALRKHIDDFNDGKIEDEALAPFRNQTKCQFALAKVEEALMGGLFIHFVFLDIPDKVFNCWIYSFVDEETGKITGYEVRPILLAEEEMDFTKEDILMMARENPEFKLLW